MASSGKCLEPGCGREANSERPAYCIRHLKSDYEAQRMANLLAQLAAKEETIEAVRTDIRQLKADHKRVHSCTLCDERLDRILEGSK